MEEAKQAADTMAQFLNRFSSGQKEFIEAMSRQHPTLQQLFTKQVLAWLKHVASPEYEKLCDGRNEYSHKIAKKILKDVEDWELNCPLI